MEKKDQKVSEEQINLNSNEAEKNPKNHNEAEQNPKSHDDDEEMDEGKNRNPCETEQKPSDHKDDEDGEEECGFCLFMKSGGCRDAFIDWEKCVEEGEANNQDVVEKCYKVTSLLKECMDRHADYYEPVLRAEKEMEEHVAEEMKEQDSEATASESGSQDLKPRTTDSGLQVYATIEVPIDTIEVPSSQDKED